jgi:8-oxo-dGTP pyrophosphatase MutT (NUDIX family)
MPAHLGANAIITCKGKLLLEKRRDSDIWGMPGGGCKKWETGRDAIAREIYEELGLRIPKDCFEKLDEEVGIGHFRCDGNHPFRHAREKCNCYPKTVQRGASSVYLIKLDGVSRVISDATAF